MNTIFSETTQIREFTQKVQANVENAKKINIDIQTMKDYDHWYMYNNQYCYFKPMDSKWGKYWLDLYILNHFVGEKIAAYFRVPSAHFFLARVQDCIGLASVNFRRKNAQYEAYDNLGGLSFLDVLKFYENNFLKNKELHPISPLLRLLAFHIYCDLGDLSDVNVLIKKTQKGFSLCPVFDYDEMFFCDPSIDSYLYESPICTLQIPSYEFNQLKELYPEINEYFHYFRTIDMEKILQRVQKEFSLIHCEKYFLEYLRQDEIKKEWVRKLQL